MKSIKSQSSLLIAEFEFFGRIIPVIVDAGATISTVPENGWVMSLNRFPIRPANVNITLGDNTVTHVDKKVLIPIKPARSRSVEQLATFYVENSEHKVLGYEALLGLNSLQLFNLDIQFLDGRAQMFHEGRLISREVSRPEAYMLSVTVDDRFLSVTKDATVSNVIKKYKSVFTDIGSEPIKGTPMRILTTHNSPIFAKLRHYNQEQVVQMKQHVQDLLDKGIIGRTYSAYAATSHIIPKRNGTGRLVINYIPLNSVTLRDSYAMPHLTDILGVLEGKNYFTTMDCAQGFYQILVDPRDRHKTAFSTPIGNFQFVRCPFGARNSGAVFQSEMNRIFLDGLYTRCIVYVDDILVFGQTREEHDENLAWVLARCKENNVKIKLEKCAFAQQEVDYLGFRISRQKISPWKERE